MDTPSRAPKRYLVPGLAALVLLACVAAVYFYLEAASLRKDPQEVMRREIQKIVSEISESMLLPEGETPTLATVSDVEKLKGQAFFANAKVGDKVVIYSGAGKAILWRPGEKKIIEVSPLGLGTQAGEASADER